MSELIIAKLVQSDLFPHLLAIVIGGIIGNLIMENLIIMKNTDHNNNQSTIGKRSLMDNLIIMKNAEDKIRKDDT